MKLFPQSKVYQLLEPGPVVMLTTSAKDRPNVMTMSWHMMLDFEPPTLACVVGEGGCTFGVLRKTRACVIAIPDRRLASKVVRVGNTHGDAIDKFKAFGLTPVAASIVGAPLIAECFANLECKVIDFTRKYDLFVLEVVKAWIDPAKKNPKTIHHCGYGRFVVDGAHIALKSRMR